MKVIKKEGLNYYNAQDLGLDEDTYSKLYAGGEADIPGEVYAKYPHLFDAIYAAEPAKGVKHGNKQ